MNILVLAGSMWHPSEMIRRGLADISDYHFDFVEDAKDILTSEMLACYPVILCCKSNNLTGSTDAPWFEENVTEVMPKEIRAYVEKGGGFLAVHAGCCFGFSGEENYGYCELIGSRFVTHPPRCDVRVENFRAHPITDRVAPFSVRDEHYQLTDFAPDVAPLFDTVSETGGRQLGGYTRQLGKGRLCVLTPGHILSVWQNAEYQKLLKNAMEWCGGIR